MTARAKESGRRGEERNIQKMTERDTEYTFGVVLTDIKQSHGRRPLFCLETRRCSRHVHLSSHLSSPSPSLLFLSLPFPFSPSHLSSQLRRGGASELAGYEGREGVPPRRRIHGHRGHDVCALLHAIEEEVDP